MARRARIRKSVEYRVVTTNTVGTTSGGVYVSTKRKAKTVLADMKKRFQADDWEHCIEKITTIIEIVTSPDKRRPRVGH